jgi:hypothetical protein
LSSLFTRSRQNSTTRDITLMLDNATPALAEQELSTYHTGRFWQGLLAYLGACSFLSTSPFFCFLLRAPLLYADRGVARVHMLISIRFFHPYLLRDLLLYADLVAHTC